MDPNSFSVEPGYTPPEASDNHPTPLYRPITPKAAAAFRPYTSQRDDHESGELLIDNSHTPTSLQAEYKFCPETVDLLSFLGVEASKADSVAAPNLPQLPT